MTEITMSKFIMLTKRLEAVITNGKKRAVDKRTVGFYTNRKVELEKAWHEVVEAYTSLGERIGETDCGEQEEKNLDIHYMQADLRYSDYMTELIDNLEQSKTKTEPTDTTIINNTTHSTTNIQLPKINLPKFDGDYNNWRAFRDLYISVIHENEGLQNVQKLHYLKGCLVGEAERLLKNIPITNDDYIPAWEKLKNRYENKRILVNIQLKKLTSQPKLNLESNKTLRTVIDTTEECLQQLAAFNVNVSTWDTLLVFLLIQKLPYNTMKLWEEHLGNQPELPTLQQFIEFLQNRARVLESVANTTQAITTKSFHTTKLEGYSNKQPAETTCPACQRQHYVTKCDKFIKMTPTQRKECINKANRCFNCFSNQHKADVCISKYACRKCNKKHNTLLHFEQQNYQKKEVVPITGGDNVGTTQLKPDAHDSGIKNYFTHKNKCVLLATARVAIRDRYGRSINARCLVDPGSQASFITQTFYKRLGYQGRPVSIAVNGLNGSQTANIKRQVQIKLNSIRNEESINAPLLVIQDVAGALPTTSMESFTNLKHLRDLQLADPNYWQPGPVDILLGAAAYAEIITQGIRKGLPGDPVAINTIYGWIVLGGNLKQQKIQSFLTMEESVEEINKNLMKFWETEELLETKTLSQDEKQCERHFQETHERLKNGQYQVQLPFKQPPELGDSYNLAVKRFYCLERKFSNNEILKTDYSKCIKEYINLGHMSKCNSNDPNSYYIPHHAVFKESTTTKLRVVFDASAKTTNNRSLNEQLLTGPTLQPKLYSTLLKWRKYKIALTGDIEKMYRMILIHPDDRKYQKIIWRNHPNENEIRYELNTVTFGTTSAPYLAIKVLQQLAVDEGNQWPLAAKAAIEDFYVDDLLTGADTIEKAIILRKQCSKMLKTGHFKLRKWSSNQIEALSGIAKEDREIKDIIEFEDNIAIKTLGIKWKPNLDVFTFGNKLNKSDQRFTKRAILSEIATLYDPLGWISPIIIKAKLIMQEIWINGCGWDSEVPETIQVKWKRFKADLENLPKIIIPRWLGYTQTAEKIELHGFCDSSIRAYGAVVYLCVKTENHITSTMITAKSKIAPIKPVTLPRLELNGAVLLAKLMKQTLQDLRIDSVKTFAWTDSMITLHWIKGHASKWKTYVANRVGTIQEIIKPECWRHVPTEYNPADLITRGVEVKDLSEKELWWKGPNWLIQSSNTWPKTQQLQIEFNLELKNQTVAAFTTNIDINLFERYSTFYRLQTVVALIKRFIYNSKNSKNKIVGNVSFDERERASDTIFSQIQKYYYSIEYQRLSNKTEIHSRSKLISLRPFLDEHNVMRVGGRLENANISYSQKHPIILPPEHHVTRLIINELHIKLLHSGVGSVLNTSRTKYWIINGKRAIRKIIHQCITCIRYRKQERTQLMGNLPIARVNISRPFTNVGIDYAGPITLKTSPHRTIKKYKGYFCVFVCMATKAIHLELVSDLTTEAFLAAFKRFIARRGLCSQIFSDCGTNFKGAKVRLEKDLKTAITQATQEVAKIYEKQGIKWHFNPPGAPHFGGLWEAAVKSIKYHLLRICKGVVFTFEQYSTLLTQIEAILNSRPLYAIDNSIEHPTALTPGHFLIGQEMIAVPEPNIIDDKSNMINKWRHIQLLRQHFWKKWSKNYLHQLQQRPKWQRPENNIRPNDVVILKEENNPPTVWPLAKVLKIYQGQDGLVRVAEVKTANGIYKRPITKLCPLIAADNKIK